MTIEEKLYSMLFTNAVARISELQAPQSSTVPYSVFFSLGQSPLATQQESVVNGLRSWDFQFSSFGASPKDARAETKKILDYLTTHFDSTLRAVFVQPGTRRVMWDDTAKLAQSMVDCTVWETLG